jgi:tetratricopeptide (TPR) repeat protein
VAPLEEAELRKELSVLVNAELLYQRGFFPRSRFSFKHALVQDVAYDSLLRKTRQEWHAKIADVMESKFLQLVETEPELLAQHYREAGNLPRAAGYWLKAGVRAQDQSAMIEALHALRQGLALVEGIDDRQTRERLEFQFQIPLGVALCSREGHAYPEVGPVFERAAQLAEQYGGIFERFHILWGTWAWRVVRDELHICMELCEQARLLLAGEDDPGLRMEALFIPGFTHFYRGEFAAARQACAEGITLYDEERCRLHARHTGQNSGVTLQSYGALSLFYLGYPEQALKIARNAVALARELRHPFSLIFALHHLAWLNHNLRDADEVLRCSEEQLALATQQGFIFWKAEAHLWRGNGFVLQNRLAEAEREIVEGLQIFEQTGAALSLSHFYTMLAEIRFRLDDQAGALDWIAQALKASARFGNTFHLPEIHRLHGEILSVESPAAAEQHFRQSLEVARRQSSLSSELRVAVSLAKLWQQQGLLTEGVNLLESVCGRFQEGHQSPDYQEAQSLIATLR